MQRRAHAGPVAMKPPVENYSQLLEEAIAEAKAAGLEAAADVLQRSCFGVVFTTSNEMLAEHGVAIARFASRAEAGVVHARHAHTQCRVVDPARR